MVQKRFDGFRAFTLIELLAVLAVLTLLGSMLATGLARTRLYSGSAQCINSLRQLTLAWRQYTEDNKELLLTYGYSGFGIAIQLGRTNWVQGNLSFYDNPGNWDPHVYIYTSPMFRYTGRDPLVFRCPADQSTVLTADGSRKPRVRSRSMSQAFGVGEWLDSSGGTAPVAKNWRVYRQLEDIALPAKTFVFSDEHPDSMNDGTLASSCGGNQPADPPTASYIIDYPANYHHGGCGFSFSDGHCETHKWIGSKIRNAPITYDNNIILRVSANDSWVDMHWLAENTTVRTHP